MPVLVLKSKDEKGNKGSGKSEKGKRWPEAGCPYSASTFSTKDFSCGRSSLQVSQTAFVFTPKYS